MQTPYVQFISVPKEQRPSLLSRLGSDIKKAAEENDGMNRFSEALGETISKAERKLSGESHVPKDSAGERKIELKFDVSYNCDLDMYAWSFNGFNDAAMIKYAKKYNFPRGCIVLWREGRTIDLRGFYPKVSSYILMPLEALVSYLRELFRF